MKILAEISVGELFDKITILNIKTQKIQDSEKLTNIKNELNFLNNQASNINVKDQESLNQNIFFLKRLLYFQKVYFRINHIIIVQNIGL